MYIAVNAHNDITYLPLYRVFLIVCDKIGGDYVGSIAIP